MTRSENSSTRIKKHDPKVNLDPDPSPSDSSDSSNDGHSRRRQHTHTEHQKKDPIRLCAKLTAKLLTTAFKSKMIRFKLDEDPLQHRIYFLTFIDSFNMVFSQYRETYEVLRDYPKMEG